MYNTRHSNISIVIPSMGQEDFLGLLLDSIVRTSTAEHEICIGLDPEWRENAGPSPPLSAKRVIADGPGMHRATEAAVGLATNEWLVMLHEDMVLMPGWDDLAFSMHPNRIVCLELIDPVFGSWPPTVQAGRTPSGFNQNLVETEAARRRANRTASVVFGGPFFATAIMHRNRWLPWPEWSGTMYRTHDMAWYWSLHTAHPEVAFGYLPGRCAYHFVSGAVSRRAHTEPDIPGEFVGRYGMTVEDADRTIQEHSERLWREGKVG